MHIINTGDNDTLFVLDGLPYRKGLYEVFYSQESMPSATTVGIRSIYNQQTLLLASIVSQYEINGDNFSNVTDLVNALSVVLGFNMGVGGNSESGINTIITDDLEYTLTDERRTTIITFTGTTSTLTLPSKSDTVNFIVLLTNAGSGAVTITSPDGIWEGGSQMESTTVNTGTTARIINDGLEYRINS